MIARILVPMCLLSACFTEDGYDAHVAASYCTSVKQCDEDGFWGTYRDGTPECRETVAGAVRARRYGQDEGRSGLAVRTQCSWVPDAARDCLVDLNAADCALVLADDWPEDCARAAWDCVTVTQDLP